MRTTSRIWGWWGMAATVMLLWAVGSIVAADVRSDAGNVGFQLLEEPVNPAVIGMGTAGTAYPGTGFHYYNPALPFLAGRRSLTLEYGRYPAGDLNRAHLEASWLFKKFFLAGAFHSEAIEDIFITTADGKRNLGEAATAQFTAAALSAGYIWYDRIAAGVAFVGMQDRIVVSSAFAWALSLGGAFRAIPGKLNLGLAVIHPQVELEREGGRPMRLLWGSTEYADSTVEWDAGPSVPGSVRLGGFWTDTIRALPYSASLDLVYRATDGRLMVPVGVELRPVAPLAIRMGKRFGHDTELLNMGIGVSLDPMAFDMAVTIPRLVHDAELKWLLAVSYRLGGDRGETRKSREETVEAPSSETSQSLDNPVSPITPLPDSSHEGQAEPQPEDSASSDAQPVEELPALQEPTTTTVGESSLESAAGTEAAAEAVHAPEMEAPDVDREPGEGQADSRHPASGTTDSTLSVDEESRP